MPPAMFEGEDASRRRRAAGICIQRNQESRNRRRIQESRSEEELTTSGGGDMEEEEEEDKGSVTDSYPRGRRNAIRGARVHRRATCAADGSYASSVVAARRNAAERPG